IRGLKGIRLVACGLLWNEGYPIDGTSALSRYFDDRPFKAALWFQAAGDTRGQAWSGLFRDVDGNGIMEFSPPDSPLHPQAWSRELNFLTWRPVGGAMASELPAGTKLRISLQWREVHDPDLSRFGEDAYRKPLANLKVVVFHQPDPRGAKRPADDLDYVTE